MGKTFVVQAKTVKTTKGLALERFVIYNIHIQTVVTIDTGKLFNVTILVQFIFVIEGVATVAAAYNFLVHDMCYKRLCSIGNIQEIFVRL